MPMMKRSVTLPLVALLALPALAQEPYDDSGAEEPRRYTVEMIVFKYNEDVGLGNERFVPEAPPELDDEFVFGDQRQQAEPPGDALTQPQPVEQAIPDQVDERFADRRFYEIERLDDDQLTMADTWEHLERLDVYRPIMHFGWTQHTLPDDVTDPRPLDSFARPPGDLNGELELYLGRYLHLVVDLSLDAAGGGGRFEDDGLLGTAPIRYRIQEDRIFKSGEMRYFDHPKFGVLAKITRADGDEELLGFDGQ